MAETSDVNAYTPAWTPSGFHAHDGWHFRREGDEVHVGHWSPGGKLLDAVTLDAPTWASIVAAVSLAGEHGDTFHLAEWLHGAGNLDWVKNKAALDKIVAG